MMNWRKKIGIAAGLLALAACQELPAYLNKDTLLARAGGKELRHVLRASACLSADVSAAFDPAWPEVAEKHNCAYLGYGPVLTKYTGARGKSSTNDAPAEYVAFVEGILEDAGVTWQTGELGKVDQGGGGTIAKRKSNSHRNYGQREDYRCSGITQVSKLRTIADKNLIDYIV